MAPHFLPIVPYRPFSTFSRFGFAVRFTAVDSSAIPIPLPVNLKKEDEREVLSGHGRPRRDRGGGQLGRFGRRDHQPDAVLAHRGKLDDFHAHIKRICDIVGPDCPVSAESVAMTRDEIVRDGRELAAIAPNVVVKIPTMVEGLAATRALADEGIPVNMTLCFTVPQAILAARAGARYISPFVGRFDDISEDGLAQLDDVVRAIGNYDFSEDTVNGEQIEIIAASIRSANHVTQAALMGADIATVPFGILKKCVQHPLTDRGLESFLKDWEKVQNA